MIQDNLLALRLQHRFTQAQVAEAVGVSRQAVAKWENGTSSPDIASCAALSNLYDVTIDDLVQYEQEKEGGIPLPPRGKHIFGSVTVTEEGTVPIPEKARALFGISPGDKMMWLVDVKQGMALLPAKDVLDMLEQMKKPEA